tara:strand:+ start:269 stop:583 length:315 start_codon:yes stop_codon:yes gene_type:complete
MKNLIIYLFFLLGGCYTPGPGPSKNPFRKSALSRQGEGKTEDGSVAPTFAPEEVTHIFPFVTIVVIIVTICIVPFLYRALSPYPPKFFRYIKKKIDQKLDKSLK